MGQREKPRPESPQEAVIKAAGGEGGDAGVHAVLGVQHQLRVSSTLQPQEEALAEVGADSLPREDCRRKLRGIPDHDNHPVKILRRAKIRTRNKTKPGDKVT